MHIALLATLAKRATRQKHTVPTYMLGIDPSDEMTRVGRELIKAINAIDRKLMHGSGCLQVFRNLEDADTVLQASKNVPTVLSVMHAIYKENIADIKPQIMKLIAKTNPEIIIVTHHSRSVTRIDEVFSQYISQYRVAEYLYRPTEEYFQFNGELRPVTTFRRTLSDRVEASYYSDPRRNHDSSVIANDWMIGAYQTFQGLKYSVTWTGGARIQRKVYLGKHDNIR